MAQQVIDVGTAANDRTGDTWRNAWIKQNANNTELYASQTTTVIVINAEADYPTQDATTITLETGFHYLIGTPYTQTKSFVPQPNSSLAGPAPNLPSLTYTGTAPLFATTSRFRISTLSFSCANSAIMSHAGPGFFVMSDAICSSCDSIGTVDGGILSMVDSAIFGVASSGLSWTGTGNQLLMQNSLLITANVLDMVDLGTATFSELRILSSALTGPVGAVMLKGAAASANIEAGAQAQVSLSSLNNGATALSGIDAQDVSWDFSTVVGVPDSRNTADTYLTASRTVPNIGSGVYGAIAGGNWASDISDRFTVDVDGIFTYIGNDDIEEYVRGSAIVEISGGGAALICSKIAVDTLGGSGLVVVDKSIGCTQNSTPTQIMSDMLVALSTGYRLQLWTSIVSGSDTDVSEARLIIGSA